MRRFGSLLAILCVSGLFSAASFAITLDEIIKLKQAGVADSTIELLIKRRDARSAGVWKQDGWIVHATPRREWLDDVDARQAGAYPLFIYPRVLVGRR